jgi:hypothetical protein
MTQKYPKSLLRTQNVFDSDPGRQKFRECQDLFEDDGDIHRIKAKYHLHKKFSFVQSALA